LGWDDWNAMKKNVRATLRVWEVATRKTSATRPGPSGIFGQVVFSADGLALWDTSTGEHVRDLQGHTIGASNLSFSPDGKRLASCSLDTTLRLWDVASGAALHTLKGHAEQVRAVAFSPDGTRIVSGARDKTVRIWDSSTGKLLHTMEEHVHDVTTVAFSPNGTRVVSGSVDAAIRVWDAVTGNHLLKLDGTHSVINAVAFSVDGKLIASGSNEFTVRLWNADTGAVVAKLEGHSDPVVKVAFLSSTLLRSMSTDGEVRFWQLPEGKLLMAQKPINGKNALVQVTADHHVDFVGPDACSAHGVLRCRIGSYSFPFDVCEERLYAPGIFAKFLNEDKSYLEPEFEPSPMACRAPVP
jgi:WD40 repeat protein